MVIDTVSATAHGASATANRDYIPRGLAQFNEWYTNLVNYVKKVTFTQDNPWTHIPVKENNAFFVVFDNWTAVYTLSPYTPGQRVARDEARRAEASSLTASRHSSAVAGTVRFNCPQGTY